MTAKGHRHTQNPLYKPHNQLLLRYKMNREERHLGELPGHEGLHKNAVHDLQPVNVTPLQLLEVGRCEVAGTAVPGKPARAAVEVEVVVFAHVAVHGCTVQSAGNVLADAQAILLYQAGLLAGHASTKPASAPYLKLSNHCRVKRK